MLIPPDSIIIGSKIDIDISDKVNRFAFYGKMIEDIKIAPDIKIYKNKQKEGKILRLEDDNKAIVIDLFKKDSNYHDFIGRSVYIKYSNVTGVIQKSFGTTGKLKVDFNENLRTLVIKHGEKEFTYAEFVVVLEYKKYVKLI